MGKNSKQQEAEQARELRQRLKEEELQKKKQQNKIIMYTVIGIVAFALIAAAIGLIVTQCGKVTPKVNSMKNVVFNETDKTTDYVKLTVSYTDKSGAEQTGDIIIQLSAKAAPITVKNFQKLVSEGFYNGLTFHRVLSGFMIQGGDPLGNGGGGSGSNIKGEFSSNGVDNPLLHKRGIISMARSNGKNDSASSQFFIVHEDASHLDGDYAAFGWVVSGMDTVDGIAGIEVKDNGSGERSQPVHPVTISKAVFVQPNN